MSKLVINGGKQLNGEVSISGSKNAALPILSASLLAEGLVSVSNVPKLQDVETLIDLLAAMGVNVIRTDDHTIELSAAKLTSYTAPYHLVKKMRASILVLGPLLARFGQANVSFPGGCAIGNRSVDMHLEGLRAMGASINIEHGYIRAECEGQLRGAEIYHDSVSVGATENLMMAACLARGQTVIHNAAREPEIVDLGECLIRWGAKVKGLGSSKLVIEGVKTLSGGFHRVIPDRIEAGTFMTAVTATGGRIKLANADPSHLYAVMKKLRDTGAKITSNRNSILIEMSGKKSKAVDIKTAPYPGLPTDMQALFTALSTVSEGTCFLEETIFENRFMHVQELKRMGADISVKDNIARVVGIQNLYGAEVMASDLRASAALIIAGLVASGKTTVFGMEHTDRGYENIDLKLASLGADIVRI